MGKQTRYFRQSKRSMSGSRGAGNYAKVTRLSWHTKILDLFKVRGKGNNGQS